MRRLFECSSAIALIARRRHLRRARVRMRYVARRLRGGEPLPPRPHGRHVLLALLGSSAAIAATGYLSQATGHPWLMAPFGASCVLAFAVPDSPLAQPRNLIGGHLLTTGIGLAFLMVAGSAPWAMAAAVGIAIALMQLTRTVHPPAGANPLIIMLTAPGWAFLFNPVFCGSALIVLLAILVNNLDRERAYPRYWF